MPGQFSATTRHRVRGARLLDNDAVLTIAALTVQCLQELVLAGARHTGQHPVRPDPLPQRMRVVHIGLARSVRPIQHVKHDPACWSIRDLDHPHVPARDPADRNVAMPVPPRPSRPLRTPFPQLRTHPHYDRRHDRQTASHGRDVSARLQHAQGLSFPRARPSIRMMTAAQRTEVHAYMTLRMHRTTSAGRNLAA